MTATVNQMKSPNQFLKKRFFSNHNPVSTEDIEIGVLVHGREIAPFVRKNGEAIIVGGHDAAFQTVSAPNIRIKRPFTPSELLFNRRPGTVIFPTGQEQVSALQAHVARDLGVMADMVTNAEEWLCAMAIRGQITYQVSDTETFQITFPRSGDNVVTLTTFWNDADLSKPNIEGDVLLVKRTISEAVGLGVTDVILGSEASDAFLAAIKYQNSTATQSVLTQGKVNYTTQFSADGVIYLGNYCGLDWWEYSRTANLNGVDTPMIRAKYAEFLCNTPAAERVLYYGAIPDMEALEAQLFQGERFSKSWLQKDPSAMMALVHSRPLPVPRIPDAGLSMKVVSG